MERRIRQVGFAFKLIELLAVICLSVGASRALAQVTIYQDLFNDQQNINKGGPYTQSLAGSVPTVRNSIAGGTNNAIWLAGVETGGWGQRDYNNSDVATPTSSNFLPFTPVAGLAYKLQATIDTTGAAGLGTSWFTVGFTSSQHNWNGTDSGTIDTAHLVRFNDATSSTISYTISGDALVAAGIQYVGWITDGAGTVNLSPNTPQVKIDNFSLVQIVNPCTNGYAANGATSGTVPVDGTIYSSNATVTVLGNVGSLAKSGYNFAGWNTAADGSGTAYSPSNTFVITSNTVLYAQWTPAPVETILLSDNFNSVSGGASTFNNTLAADQSGSLATVSYTVAGYSADYKIQHGNGGQMLLAGWNSGAALDLYASLNHNFSAEANLYNQPLKVQFDVKVTDASNPNNWASIAIGSAQNLFVNNATNKFSSLFRMSGGTQQFASGADVSSGFTWTATNSTISVILSDTNKFGSAFNGNGSVARIYVNGILTYTRTLSQMAATDGYITFEANGAMAYYDNLSVSVAPIYSVTYSGNGSTGGSAPADSRSPYVAASTVTVLGNTGSLTNNGFYFGGWNTAANGTSTTYLPGNTFVITNNTTLYARWLSGYVVTYTGNGNTGGSVPADTNFYAPGASAIVLGPNTLVKTGYAFASWNTAANGTGTSYLPGTALTVSNNTPFYARWNVVDVTWNNGAGTGNWNNTDTNWSGFVWNSAQPCNAYFTTVGGTINLTQPITAGSVNVGNVSLNVPNITFANGSLTASSLTMQGYGSNGGTYSSNPTLTLGVPTVSVAGDLAVGRANLVINSGTVAVNRIISAAASADWADVTINGGTVTATNGVNGSVNTTATFQLDLNGGSLYTPFIKVADREAGGGNSAWLTFNGTVVHPTVNTNNFITLYGGNQNTYVGDGGVNFSTDGHDITVGVNLLASGTGGLTKSGAGKLTLTGNNTYSGPTHVLGGVLSLGSTNSLGSLPVDITNGAAMNLNYTGQIQVTGLSLNGVDQPIGTYGATGSGATYINNTYFTGTGVLNVVPVGLTWNNGAGTRNWNSTDLNWTGYVWNKNILHGAIFDSVGVGTVTLTEAITAQFVTFNTAGYTLTNGSLTLTGPQTVSNNVNATIASPIVSGALNKYGSGMLTLTGTSTYSGGTTVNGGTMQLVANGGNCPIAGTLTVNPGATVTTTGDGTGLGWNGGQKMSTLNINGGTVNSAGTLHIWNLGGGVNLTGGILQAAVLQWGDTLVNTFASSTNSVIGGQINIRADINSPNGSLLQLNVADGPAATDLLISANITESGLPVNATTGGHCGISKTGAGMLRITGSVQISGVISVEAGTLDFAPSAVNTNARIMVASSAHLILSNAGTNVVKNVYIDGAKLAAGRWGAPGSVAAGTADYESPVFSGPGVLRVTDSSVSNRERWKRMNYGQFTHYVWNGSGYVTLMPDGSPTPNIDYVANSFDATKYANDLQSMGVEYVIFTAWHANFFPLFNSAAVVRSLGIQRNSTRDMLGDMIAAVRAKGIRVLFYTHPNQPVIYDWWGHNNMINDVYGEMIDRYGDQIDGLYMDENDPGGNQNSSVDFARLGQTIRRRNPDLVLIQNFYGNLYCNDVPMGESGPAGANFSKDVSWPSVSAYAQVMSATWSAQVPTNQYTATRSPQGIFRGAVVQATSCTDGGGWAWAAGPFPGGIWEQGVLETMQGAGQLMAPVAVAVTNTYPSTSFSFSWSWGGATRSVDDTKEYIHVLWPPSGNTLTLPAPMDGKVFTNAWLLANNNAVTLVQNPRSVQLTLTGTNTWDTNDTVITLDVASGGDLYLANDTTADATYTGSWNYNPNRNTTEFLRDVHETTVNGDYVEFAFNGTDIELLATSGSDRGTVDIFIDGAFQQTVSAQTAGTQYRKVIYRQTGLPRGNHKVKAVKTGGTYFTVDAFRASELIDSAQPDVAYQALTFFNNTDTTSNGVGYIEYDWNWQWQARDRNEYNWDAHWAAPNGSTFWIHFNGTGVQFIGTADGIIDFYLDGIFVTEVNMRNMGGLARVLGLDLKGLPAGSHTLTGVKVGDTYALVDAFFVYNSPNSSWSSQSDSTSISNGYQRSYAFSDAVTVPFQGTGIEVIAPHSSAGGTVAVIVSAASASLQGGGYQGISWQAVNQYAGATWPQSVSFASRNVANLSPGNYLLSMSHNRSFGSISLDAFRFYKNQPGTGVPYFWGATGGGGSGTWNVNTTANWWDGANSQVWYDAGAADYAAIFQGTAGTVTLASGVNVNRLTFNTTGYTLTNNSINFNGLNPSVSLASNVTATVASIVTGSAALTVNGPGTLTLSGANTYNGGTTVNGGMLELKNNNWIFGNVSGGSVTVSNSATLRANNSVANQLNGLTLANGTVDAVNGGGGNADWGNCFLTGNVSASGTSYLNADIALRAASVTFDVGSRGTLNVGGVLHNGYQFASTGTPGGSPANIIKSGAGTLRLNGTNAYTGATTVGAGTLGGTGSIAGPVTVQSGATLAPGASIGALSISNTLTLQAGSQTVMEINAATGTNDLVRGITTVNYGGTLVITNLAGNVSPGQTFKLFSAANRTGNFSAVTAAPGVTWNFNPTNGVLTAISAVATNPTNLTASVSGTNLTLSWPANHTGWTLLSQTNNLSLGISAHANDWLRLPGSSATNQIIIPLAPNQPAGYYRLVYP